MQVPARVCNAEVAAGQFVLKNPNPKKAIPAIRLASDPARETSIFVIAVTVQKASNRQRARCRVGQSEPVTVGLVWTND